MSKYKIPDELFELDPNLHQPSELDRKVAEMRAATAFAENPLSTADAYFDSMQKGAKQSMREIVETETAARKQAVRDMAIDNIPEYGEVFLDVEEEIDREAQDPLAPFRMYLEEISGEGADREIIDSQAESMWRSAILEEAFSERGLWQKTKDIAGLLFWPNEALLAGRVSDMGWFNTKDGVDKMAFAFQSKPREERMQAFMELVDIAREETPNAIKAQMLLRRITDPLETQQARVDLTLDQLGLGAFALDVATLGTAGGARAVNLIKLAKTLRNEKLAVDAIEASARSEVAAGVAGVTREGAAHHLSPVTLPEELLGGAPNDLRASIAERIALQNASLRILDENILKEGLESVVDLPKADRRIIDQVMRESPVELDRVEVIERSATGVKLRLHTHDSDKTMKLSDELTAFQKLDSTGMESYRVVDRGVDKFEVEYVVPGETTPRRMTFDYSSNQIVEKPYILDDVRDSFNVEGWKPQTTLTSYLASPQLKFASDQDSLVNPWTRMLFQSARYRNTLSGMFRQTFNLTDKKGRERVARALEEGNLSGEVFDYQTLKTSYGLTDKDVEAYHGFRNIMDRAWHLKNKEVRERLIAQDLRQYVDSYGNRNYVKTYTSAGSAQAAIQQSGFESAYIVSNTGSRTLVPIRGEKGSVSDLQELFDEGYVMLRQGQGSNAFRVGSDGDTDLYSGFIFVKNEDVTEIGPKVLNYREGYIPIIYGPDANYFGQRAVYGQVDGSTVQVGVRTPVYFTSKTEAQNWARSENYKHLVDKYKSEERALRALNDPNEQLPYSFKYDREMGGDELEHIASLGFGGTYTGARAEERLVRGMAGEAPEMLNPFTAMQRYMDNIAGHLPMASYRLGIEQLWINHAKKARALPPDYKGGFAEAYSLVRDNSALDSGVRAMLKQSHDHIAFNVRMPTGGEREINSWTRSLAENMEKWKIFGPQSATVKALHRLDHANPIDAVRTATFHTLLGLYNPAQYLVQGMGSTVAMAADPTIFPKAYPTASLFHIMDNVANPDAVEGALRHLSRLDPNIGDKWRAWRKMGLFDEVVSSRADYGSLYSGHHVGGDMMERIFRTTERELDRGLFFYKAGELWNRRYSVSAAMERRLADGLTITTDADIKAIMDQANRYMLNMHRTAKAEWQKGVMSIPTQFLQVHTKFIESLIGTGMTGSQRANLAWGQAALFGTMGVPFGQAAVTQVMGGMGYKPGDLSEGQIAGIKGGAIGYVTQHLLGFDNNVAQRGAIPVGIEEVFDRLFQENTSWVDVLSGATGGALDRTVEAGTHIRDILSLGAGNYSAAHMQAIGAEVIRISTTGRNANTAYQLFNNKMLKDRNGTPLVLSDDINTRSKILQGLGFGLSDLQEMYAMERTARDVNEHVRELTNQLSRYFAKVHGDEYDDSTDLIAMRGAISSMLDAESPEVRRRVLQGFYNKLTNPETRYDRASQKYFQRIIDEMNDTADLLYREGAGIYEETE